MTATTQHAAKVEAVREANAHLNNVGMPTYTELWAMLVEAENLGLRFDIGSAYIRRAYIVHQDDLVNRIDNAKQTAMQATLEA